MNKPKGLLGHEIKKVKTKLPKPDPRILEVGFSILVGHGQSNLKQSELNDILKRLSKISDDKFKFVYSNDSISQVIYPD